VSQVVAAGPTTTTNDAAGSDITLEDRPPTGACHPVAVLTTTRARPTLRWLGPLAVDLGCVVALAAGGKSSHEADASDWVVLTIAWPFAAAAAVTHAWLVSRGRPTRRTWPEGAVVLATTYVVGMLLRAASGRGLAPGFLIVAGAFLALTMLGWRVVVQLAAGRHAR